MPRPLHWFKWQAYTTWLSGVALLVVVYYAGGRALLTDPARANLTALAAMGVAIGGIIVGWLIYDGLWRFVAPRSAAAAGAASIVALVLIVYILTSLLSGRAAFLHVGALLATIMAGNVAMTIMPSQRVLVSAVTAGRAPDPALAIAASTHFPGIYGHPRSWILMLVLIAVGAAVRHILNVRFTFRQWVPALGLTVATGFAVLLVVGRGAGAGGPISSAAADIPSQVTFADARSIIDRRCAACHSATPSIEDFGAAPGGVSFDDPARIQALAARIRARAVETRTMPLGNRTNMTDRERALLARWIDQGAQ
jgi:uncharacterized membrane protein